MSDSSNNQPAQAASASVELRLITRLDLGDPRPSPITGLGFRAGGSFVAVTESGWRVEYHERAGAWQQGHGVRGESPARHVAVAPDGRTAIALADGRVILSPTMHSVATVELDGPAVCTTHFDDRGRLAACTGTERVWLWTPASSAPHVIDISPRKALDLAWIDGGELVVAGDSKLQRVGRTGPSAVENDLSGASISLLAASPASRLVAVVQADSDHVALFDSRTLTDIGVTVPTGAPCTAVTLSHDGGFLLAGDSDGFLTLHSLVDGQQLERWQAHDSSVTAVAFASDDRRALSGSQGGEVGIWRVDETRPSLPILKSDLEHGDDALGIDRDVRALTRVILARELRPPMAIGIFGDWGTGKSFFLSSMHRQIERECARAHARASAGETSPYVANTAQITFNAWHYMEGNLWASLMAHLFDELGERLRPEQPAVQTRRDLVDALETTKEAKRAARERLDAVRERLDAARSREEELRAELERERIRQQQLKGSDILPMTGKVLTGILDRKTDELRGDTAEQARAATEEWRKTIASLRTTRGRIWMLLRWAWSSKRLGVVLVLVVVLAALGVLVLYKLDITSDNIMYTLAALLGPAVYLGRKAADAWRIVEQPLDAALDHLEEHRVLVDAANEERLEKALAPLESAVAESTANLTSTETDLARAQAAYDRINLDMEAARAAVADADDGRRLLRFLDERVSTSDYRQHLGTISLIKRDLATMANFLSPEELAGDRPADKPDEAASGAVVEPSPISRRAHIDRIVLYIDDLDRCPPARVVEVLQAVHLLLGMRLFVVVVAVDSRWLMRSLDEHYAELLSDDDSLNRDTSDRAEVDGGEIRRSTPHNYLEKIFQIPYILAPMDAHGFGQLVSRLAAPQRPDSALDDVAVRAAWRASADDTGPSSGLESPVAHATAMTSAVHANDADDARTWTTGAAARLSPEELSYMRALHTLIATPRAVKAFVNIYRLVRARLEEPRADEPSLAAYLRAGEYLVALLMLAIQVGRSRQAGLLCAALASGDRPDDIDTFIAEHIAVTPGNPPRNAIAGPLPADEAASWRVIAERMQHLRQTASLPAETAPYAVWAVRMRRFSFDPWRRLPGTARTPAI